MSDTYADFTRARDEVSASSAGGAPFLICYGTTFAIVGALAFFLPRETSALLAMFQGAVALPVAFWLERRMGTKRLSDANPLKDLSAQLAMSQALALPFLIVVYSTNPGQIPPLWRDWVACIFSPTRGFIARASMSCWLPSSPWELSGWC